jgi:ATP-dependent DNA ligase
MKAVLAKEPFSDPGWIFERKLDGVRALAIRDGKSARLVSRTGRALNATYPELVDALERDPCGDFVADEGGITSFSRLQGRMQLSDPDAARRSGIAVFLYLFDLLRVDGREPELLAEQEEPPFADVHPVPRDARWTRPELVAQVAFTEWTRDGRLRHPRYLGLRDDKPAREVVRERPS